MIVHNGKKRVVGGVANRAGLLRQPGAGFAALMFGQPPQVVVAYNLNTFMSLSKLAGVAALFLCGIAWLAFPTRGMGQTNYYAAYGSEYAVAGTPSGDQMLPDVAVNPSGG